MEQKIIKNPFNYSGSKNRIMNLIFENLPKDFDYVYDIFGGSSEICMSIGVPCLYNDVNLYIFNLIKTIRECDIDYILKNIEDLIEQYNLSKFNKNEFIQFRKDFNECAVSKLSSVNEFSRHIANFWLLTLIYFSFNHQMVFNKSGKFSVPSGYKRSSFNLSLRNKLIEYKSRLDEFGDDFEMVHLDFRELYKRILKWNDYNLSGKLFTLDSPYLISDDTYSRTSQYKWTEQDFDDLIEMCHNIDKHGGKFMLFDMLEKDGIINEGLLSFSKCYRTINTGVDFNNSSYQRKNKKNTKEIMVINY